MRALLAAMFLAGCAPKKADKPAAERPTRDASNDDAPASCQNDPRVDAYVENLSKTGEYGVLVFHLLRSDPAPPARGDNTFTFKIAGNDGTPASADLRVNLTQPDRNLPSLVDPMISFDVGMGIHTVTPLHMHIGGVWRLDLEARIEMDAGITDDLATFYFCIP